MASYIIHANWFWFVLGAFVGTNIAFVLFAILNAGHRADETEADRIRRRLDQASRGGHDQVRSGDHSSRGGRQ